MKKIILFLLIVLLFSFNNSPKERYFLVGYSTGAEMGAVWYNKEDGAFPDYSWLIETIKKEKGFKSRIAIISLYEFRNKREYEKFCSTYK